MKRRKLNSRNPKYKTKKKEEKKYKKVLKKTGKNFKLYFLYEIQDNQVLTQKASRRR